MRVIILLMLLSLVSCSKYNSSSMLDKVLNNADSVCNGKKIQSAQYYGEWRGGPRVDFVCESGNAGSVSKDSFEYGIRW